MKNFLQVIGALTILYLAWLLMGFMFAKFGIGYAYTTEDVVYAGLNDLEEAWLEKDLEALDCSKWGEERYGAKYGALMAVHASMCTAISPTVSKFGEDWEKPLQPLPEGFSLIEESPDLPTGFTLIGNDEEEDNTKNK